MMKVKQEQNAAIPTSATSDWLKANRHEYRGGFVTTDGQPACRICGNVKSFGWHIGKRNGAPSNN